MGFTRDKLRGANFAGAGYGLYRPTSWEFTLPEAARALCAATPGAWISHTTAAQLHGLILPPWLEDSTELHLSKPRKFSNFEHKIPRVTTLEVSETNGLYYRMVSQITVRNSALIVSSCNEYTLSSNGRVKGL